MSHATDALTVSLWADPELDVASIAARLKCSKRTVERRFKRLGLGARLFRRGLSGGRHPYPIDDRLRHLWAIPTISVPVIAERLGVSIRTVRGRAQRLGLPKRKRGRGYTTDA